MIECTTARRAVLALLALVVATMASAGAAQAKGKGTEVRVMTRNLYLGADLSSAINSKSQNEL